MTERESLLRERAAAHGQEQVFASWERLGADERALLLDQLAAIDFELTDRLAEFARASDPERPRRFEPPEVFPAEPAGVQAGQAAAARRAGEERLAAGEVGYLLVAGGQASRLGYDGPKGTFPVGPVSGRSLFELHARRLRSVTERHGVRAPWYVMTSPANDATTRAFFEANAWFGLDPEDLFFFAQAMLPALDWEGRILRSAPGSLFLAPTGHGGVLSALAESGGLADAQRRGLTALSYFQVDNPLVLPADPLFLGLHSQAGAEMSTKVVPKRDADEKVGVIGRADGRLGCIEYSDLPAELREARDDAGELLFRAGNTAAHLLELEFLARITGGELELPWHVARKSMRVIDEGGDEPVERTGHKFETFVFDALGLARASVTLEVHRAEEFSPVKNAEGQDSPTSARRDLCRLHAGWLRAAGVALPSPAEHGEPPVEVDPLLAQSAADLAARMPLQPLELEAGHLYE